MLNPPYGKDFCRSARWAARSRGRVQRHPDWMLISAGLLERKGFDVRFIDGAVLNLEKENIKRAIEEFKPDLSIIHTTTPTIYNDIEYARLAKDYNSMVVLIGPHVSVEYDSTLRIAPFIDAIAIGEYDYTLLDIAEGRDLSDIKSIAYLKDGRVIRTDDREPVDVNTLPFPAWHHIKPEWYKDGGKRFPFLTLISGRGCPNRCTFCRDTSVMYGRKVRLRMPELVVDEMEYDLKLFPYIREIMFETDTFTTSRVHVQGICEEILKRGLKITWSCNVRVDMDIDLLPLMKRAGCRMLMVGFEFGTQEALDSVKKGVTIEMSKRFAIEAKRHGFTIHGCFMIGAPVETRESAIRTIEFAKSLPLDTIQISGICPYPGTELYRWAKEMGYLIPQDWREWVGDDLEQVTLLSYPWLSKEEIDELIDKGLREFYLRPYQIIRMLFSIRSAGDLMRKLYGFRSFLDYFLRKRKCHEGIAH